MADGANPVAAQALIAELSALRAEMAARIGMQQHLLVGSATVAAIVFGVVANHADVKILFVVPFVAVALGFAHYDHARWIGYFGLYVGQVLTEELRRTTGDETLPTIEDVLNEILFDSRAPRWREQVIASAFYIMIYFVLPGGALGWLALSGEVSGWYWALLLAPVSPVLMVVGHAPRTFPV